MFSACHSNRRRLQSGRLFSNFSVTNGVTPKHCYFRCVFVCVFAFVCMCVCLCMCEKAQLIKVDEERIYLQILPSILPFVRLSVRRLSVHQTVGHCIHHTMGNVQVTVNYPAGPVWWRPIDQWLAIYYLLTNPSEYPFHQHKSLWGGKTFLCYVYFTVCA